MYGLIDILLFEVMLNTCNITEIPPNPNKNAHIIIVILIVLVGILQIYCTPFVNSIKPVYIPCKKLLSIPIKLKKGDVKLIII